MTYRIIVDRSACAGFGSCGDIDPVMFAVAGDGTTVAFGSETAVPALRPSHPAGERILTSTHETEFR